MKNPLPSDIFQPGQILNQTYEIEGVLGRGGTGEVYRAVNLVTGRTFAIKALIARFSDSGIILREEQIRKIVHSAVVRYNECTRTDTGNVILVMDYIPGGSLADAMTAGALTPRDILIVGHRIAEGLAAAHAQGIVHRDLSPDNIILKDGRPDQATLIDFGIAKDTAEGAQTIVEGFAGKYEYAAPEQLDGHADARSDVYALGATLLAAYRRQTPRVGTALAEIVRNKAAPLDTKGVPQPLRGLVERLAAPAHADRPEDGAQAALEIEAALHQGRAPKTKRRGAPWGAIAAGIVLVGLVGGGVAFRDTLGNLFGPGREVVSPHTLNARAGGDLSPRLTGHAPNDAAATALREAFGMAAPDAAPSAVEVRIADGAPHADWAAEATALIELLAPLDDWSLSISDTEADLTGAAPDAATRDRVLADLETWDQAAEIDVSVEIDVEPAIVFAADLRPALAAAATCGPLRIPEGPFEPGDDIPVTGEIARAADIAAIRQSLAPLIGDRALTFGAVDVVNPSVCAILAQLPEPPGRGLTAWLRNADGTNNPEGVFVSSESVMAELWVANGDRGHLFVMFVTPDGVVHNIVPPTAQLQDLCCATDRFRRIPVIVDEAERLSDPSRFTFRVTREVIGVSELIAVWSDAPFITEPIGSEEAVEDMAAILERAMAAEGITIRGIERARVIAQSQ